MERLYLFPLHFLVILVFLVKLGVSKFLGSSPPAALIVGYLFNAVPTPFGQQGA